MPIQIPLLFFVKSLAILSDTSVAFEIRTAWQNILLTPDDIRSMIHYLEQYDYHGNYCIQRFFNDIPTLGNRPDMYDTLDADSLSTANFKVILRNAHR